MRQAQQNIMTGVVADQRGVDGVTRAARGEKFAAVAAQHFANEDELLAL